MRWFLPLFFSTSLFASYIGNPADPAIMNTGFLSQGNPLIKGTTGYIYDYISNKRFVPSSPDPSVDPSFRQFALHTQSASASVIFLERLEVLGTVGGSKQNASPIDPTSLSVDYHGAYQLSWSTGLKVILLQWGKTYFCTSFDYFTIPSSPKAFFKFFNRMNLPIDLSEQKFFLREWQLTAGLASHFYFLTPYVGASYLRSHLHIKSGPLTGPIDYYNKKNWGVFYGVTVSITGRFHLNFERRIRDEFAYSFATTAVF
jgi:hypothetical protein